MTEELCPVCKGKDVDDYGCLTCWMSAAAGTWLEDEDFEEEGEQLTTATTPILDEEAMRQLGFTDHVSTRWYFCRRVGPQMTLNVTIDKATGTYNELVMDEDFGQPAYYGHMRQEIRDAAIVNIDVLVDKLNNAGLDIKLDHRAYGVKIEGETNG